MFSRNLETDNQPRISRARFLDVLFVAGGATMLSLGLRARARAWIDDEFIPEGRGLSPMPGVPLAPGEVVHLPELISLYLEAVEKNRPAEIDPTIIRSTLFHTMVFLGLDEAPAYKRSSVVFLSDPENSCYSMGYICTGTQAEGLGVNLTPRFTEADGNTKLWWLKNLQALAHEAGHLAVNRVENRKGFYSEDCSVLGKYIEGEDKRGFHRHEGYQGEVDLIRRTISKQNETAVVSVPEEFYSELARVRFFKNLLELGLSRSEDAFKYNYGYPYPFMMQGLVDIQEVTPDGWQSFWEESLSFERLDQLHRTNDRFGLFEGIGAVIRGRNTRIGGSKLSDQDRAGLGIVAFTDFVDYSLTRHKVLENLLSTFINPTMILDRAKVLYNRINFS